MFKKTLTVLVLICAASAIELTLTKTQIHREEDLHIMHQAQQNVQKKQAKDTDPNAIFDEVYLVDLKYGSTVVSSVIDTTSFESLIQAQNPGTSVTTCTGCPAESTLYVCADNCAPTGYTSDSEQADVPLYGGRAQATYKIRQLKTVSLSGATIKNYFVGLAYKYVVQDKAVTLLRNVGTLGLAYGSVYKVHQEGLNTQFTSVTKDLKLDVNNNLVARLNKDLPALFPKPVFSLKLGDQMDILTLGESKSFFGQGKSTLFHNQGKNNWALQVTGFKVGAFAVGLLQEHHRRNHLSPAFDKIKTNGNAYSSGAPATPPTTGVLAIFDSTTRFIWMDKADVTQIKTDFGTRNIVCTSGANAGEVLTCPCSSVKDFGPLTFSFNGVRKDIVIRAEDYVTKTGGLCTTNIRSFTTGYLPAGVGKDTNHDVIVIGQPIFKSQYIVFDQSDNTVTMQESRVIAPQPLKQKSFYRNLYLTLGLVLFFLALLLLISVLKQINPADIEQQPVKPQPVQVQPVLQVYTQNYPQTQFVQPQQSRVLSQGPVQQGFIPQGTIQQRLF